MLWRTLERGVCDWLSSYGLHSFRKETDRWSALRIGCSRLSGLIGEPVSVPSWRNPHLTFPVYASHGYCLTLPLHALIPSYRCFLFWSGLLTFQTTRFQCQLSISSFCEKFRLSVRQGVAPRSRSLKLVDKPRCFSPRSNDALMVGA